MACLVAGIVAGAAVPSAAQNAASASGPFGGFKHDSSAPIEITSEALEVRQAESLAVFSGDVVAGQGTLRLNADRVEVTYSEDSGDDSGTGAIRNMQAEGNVFISNGAETAQGQRAEYDVDSGTITMTGSVVLTQGDNAISGQRLVIDLNQGTGRVEGGVKSVFVPQSSSGTQ